MNDHELFNDYSPLQDARTASYVPVISVLYTCTLAEFDHMRSDEDEQSSAVFIREKIQYKAARR